MDSLERVAPCSSLASSNLSAACSFYFGSQNSVQVMAARRSILLVSNPEYLQSPIRAYEPQVAVGQLVEDLNRSYGAYEAAGSLASYLPVLP